MSTFKECKGCNLFIDVKWCTFNSENEVDACPCTECLVKVMCQRGCHIRGEAYNRTFRGRKYERRKKKL